MNSICTYRFFLLFLALLVHSAAIATNATWRRSISSSSKETKRIELNKESEVSQQIINENVEYIIKDTFDLSGKKDVIIPTGCVLNFDGGALKNGTIFFNETILEGDIKVDCNVQGSCGNKYVMPEWFYDESGDYTEAIQRAITVGVNKIVRFTGDSYKVHGAKKSNDEAVTLISNTTLFSTVKSRIYTDSIPYGWLFKLQSDRLHPAKNIIIDGLFFDQSNLYLNKAIPNNAKLYLLEWGHLNRCVIRNCKFVYCARNCVKISGVRTKAISIENNEFEYLQGVWKTNDNTSLYLRGIKLKVNNNIFKPSLKNKDQLNKDNYRFATAVELHGPINECSGNLFKGMNTCIMMPSVVLSQFDEQDWDRITHSTNITHNESKEVGVFVSVIPDIDTDEKDCIKGIIIDDNKINARHFLHFTSTNGVNVRTLGNKYITDVVVQNNIFKQIEVPRTLKDLGSSSFVGKSSFVSSVCPAIIDTLQITDNTVINCTGPLLALNYLVRGKISNVKFENNKISGLCGIPFEDILDGKQSIDYRMVGYFIVNGNGDKTCSNIIVKGNEFNYKSPSTITFPVPMICNFCEQTALSFVNNIENNGFNNYIFGRYSELNKGIKTKTKEKSNTKLLQLCMSRRFNCNFIVLSDKNEWKSVFNDILNKKNKDNMCMFGNLLFYGKLPSYYNSNLDEVEKVIEINL